MKTPDNAVDIPKKIKKVLYTEGIKSGVNGYFTQVMKGLVYFTVWDIHGEVVCLLEKRGIQSWKIKKEGFKRAC